MEEEAAGLRGDRRVSYVCCNSIYNYSLWVTLLITVRGILDSTHLKQSACTWNKQQYVMNRIMDLVAHQTPWNTLVNTKILWPKAVIASLSRDRTSRKQKFRTKKKRWGKSGNIKHTCSTQPKVSSIHQAAKQGHQAGMTAEWRENKIKSETMPLEVFFGGEGCNGVTEGELLQNRHIHDWPKLR